MAATSRNQPCPCGSGKKYKRCCGDTGSNVTVMPAFGKTESDKAIALLMAMTHGEHFAGPRAAAEREFFGKAFDTADKRDIQAALEHEQTQIAFNTWLIFDAYITKDRHRLMELVLEPDFRKTFTAGQLRFLERMANSHMRPYEIRDVRLDKGFTFKDLWNGTEIDVSERSATHYLERGETLLARIIEGATGAPEMHGGILVLKPLEMQLLLRRLRASFRAKRRKRPDLEEAEFFKEAGPQIGQAWLERFTFRMPALRTTDGDAFALQDLIFDIVDRDALIDALNACNAMEPDDNGQYVWLRHSAMGTRRTILASLTFEGSRVRASVMSNERAAALQALLQSIAPKSVRYRLTELHDVAKLKTKDAARKAAPISDVPPEIAQEALTEFSRRYYCDWIDQPIPALGGRTPRHAATLKSQRAAVAALIREIELQPSPGLPADIEWMWDELGLVDLR